MAPKQQQVATWAKSQLKWELLHEQIEQDAKEDELTAAYSRKTGKIWAKVEKEIGKMMPQPQEDATKQKEKLADKQEDQWAVMCEQHDTTLRKVLAQVEPADPVRLPI